jgi:hypothetical protein
MRLYWLLLGVLCVWRIAHLINAEDGPWDLISRLRRLFDNSFWRGLYGCFNCLSLWVAAPIALLVGEDWKEKLLLWPSLSAGAILLNKIASKRDVASPPTVIRTKPKVPCCGKKKVNRTSSAVVFENVGTTGVTVIGPSSGRRYHFIRPGARLAVRAKDAPALAILPNLSRIDRDSSSAVD